ncbi:MAG: imidazolonepropionase, partial [Sedimentitalea sp.]|nr:imidazolonepropionase [Sedimentitalea sp.]
MAASSQVLIDLDAATMAGEGAPYGLIRDAAIVLQGGRIAWVGPAADLPAGQRGAGISLGGRLVTPGLIDCHTHVVHGGNRAAEFEMRLNGASYEEVARAGGGIVSTV